MRMLDAAPWDVEADPLEGFFLHEPLACGGKLSAEVACAIDKLFDRSRSRTWFGWRIAGRGS